MIIYYLTLFQTWLTKLHDQKNIEQEYRDDFEAEAFASGEFKGVRFTRNKNGTYQDPRLQKRWESYLSMMMAIDNA